MVIYQLAFWGSYEFTTLTGYDTLFIKLCRRPNLLPIRRKKIDMSPTLVTSDLRPCLLKNFGIEDWTTVPDIDPWR